MFGFFLYMFSVSIPSQPEGSALETWLYCQILNTKLQIFKTGVYLFGF